MFKNEGSINKNQKKKLLKYRYLKILRKYSNEVHPTSGHDNDPKHTADKGKAYLDRKTHSETQAVMDWPPQSPDLNIVQEFCTVLHFILAS